MKPLVERMCSKVVSDNEVLIKVGVIGVNIVQDMGFPTCGLMTVNGLKVRT